MKLQKAERKNAKIKMGLQGPSGCGKSYGALLIAYGLCKDWSKVAVIDTENHSSELYAHLGNFNVLNLTAPYSPEKYIKAIHICEQAGMDVIIVDSLSHEWEGNGGILDIHGNMTGNSFTNWSKVTPRHNAFIQAILACSSHVIGTIRTKQDYVLTLKNGKNVPEKVGLKGVQRDGIEYDLTLVLDIDINHHTTASKDRTSLFKGVSEFTISSEIGANILEWCNNGISAERISNMIQSVETVGDLIQLYERYPAFQSLLRDKFSTRKKELRDTLAESSSMSHKNGRERIVKSFKSLNLNHNEIYRNK